MRTRTAISIIPSALVLGVCLALAGCTANHYRRSADKETYRAIAQKTPLVTNMEPRFSIEQTNAFRLDELPLAPQGTNFLGAEAESERGARLMSLEKALAVLRRAARRRRARLPGARDQRTTAW